MRTSERAPFLLFIDMSSPLNLGSKKSAMQRKDRIRAFLALICTGVVLAGCGGHEEGGSTITAASVSTVVSNAKFVMDHPGFSLAIDISGHADQYPNDFSKPDLFLDTNKRGAVIHVGNAGSQCSVRIQAVSLGAAAACDFTETINQLDASGDSTIVVSDPVNREAAQYTVHMLPPDFPAFSVSSTNKQDDGDIYLNTTPPLAGRGSYALRLSSLGIPDYYLRNEPQHLIVDFKKTILTGGQIRYSYIDTFRNALLVMDDAFRLIDTVTPLPAPDGKTYPIDLHDSTILNDGHYIIGTSGDQTVSNVPQSPGDVLVRTIGIQEIDRGKPALNWLSSDHPELYRCSTDGNNYATGTQSSHDYAHWNSVAVDADNDLLLSFRHFDSVIKMSRTNGAIRWILGGPCDQFKLTDEQKFSHQHYARRTDDGRLSVFDNGNATGLSRAVAVSIDEGAKILVAQGALPAYQQVAFDGHASTATGSAQFAITGRVFIGWGAHVDDLADVSEYDYVTGMKTFELTFLRDANGATVNRAYRAQKFL